MTTRSKTEKMRWCWLSLLVLILAMTVFSPAQQYVFRVFRQQEGLKNLSVYSMAKDRDGFLWLATENGVYRFLGNGFVRYGEEHGLKELYLIDILTDKYGDLWAASEEHLYYWTGTRFEQVSDTKIALRRSHQMVVEGPGSLLLVLDRQIYRMRHQNGRMISLTPVFSDSFLKQHTALKESFRVSIVAGDGHGGTLWVSAAKKLYAIPLSNLQNREKAGSGIAEWAEGQGIPEERWDQVVQDSGGRLWASGQIHIRVLEKGAARFEDRSIPDTNPGSTEGHMPLVEDDEGRMLAISEDSLVRWEKGSWEHIGRHNGLYHNTRITGMVFGRGGNLWLSSMGGGLFGWLGYHNWQGWNEDQGLPSGNVWAVLPDSSGKALVGTDRGIARIDSASGVVTPLIVGDRWRFGAVYTLNMDPHGVLWAGTTAGSIVRVDLQRPKAVQVTSVLRGIIGSVQMPGIGIFYYTHSSIWLVHEDGTVNRLSEPEGLIEAGNQLNGGCVSPPHGDGWFLIDNSFLHFDGTRWSRPPIDGMSAMKGSLVGIACSADGSLWSGGLQTGLWKLKYVNGRLKAEEFPLPADFRAFEILAVYVDPRGWIWLGADQGVLVSNGKEWRHLSQESGLIWNDVNQAGLTPGLDGSLWVSTSGGVSQLHHPDGVFRKASLNLAVVSVHRGDQQLVPGQNIELPWSQQPLVIQVASPFAQNRSELIFRYRMDGLSTTWSEDGDGDGVLQFPSLPPGDYTLLAQAVNPGLNSASEMYRLHVRILAPWWKSYWGFALWGLLLLGAIFAVDRFRDQQRKVRSRELEMLVSERTRELEFSREQLRVQATHDGLTGMLNRRAILRSVTQELERTRREKRCMVLALVDLDHFKRINDTWGHLAGDEAMRWFASAMGGAVRSYDHAGRYGGEEFLIALTQLPSELAMQRLEVLHQSISNLHVQTSDFDFTVTCSIGAIVVDPEAGSISVESALAIADQALYEAKAAGRNRVVLRRPADIPSNP